MTDRVEKCGLRVDAALASFIEGEVLAPLGQDAAAFWAGFADLVDRFTPVNRALLAKRDDLQARIDAWHIERAGKPIDMAQYQAFLREIGCEKIQGYYYGKPMSATEALARIVGEQALERRASPQLAVAGAGLRAPV